ncbi:MAG: hypothetical protein KIT31_40865, partial [Deltaproteobacteria bacterium]|nr:hypothetical protein [Deltaproteobacteria bacterium]
PVAGARVVAGPELVGDSLAVALPFPGQAGAMRDATTAADGTFAIPDGSGDGVIVAQLGDRRSLPAAVADDVTLALGPTSRLAGRVDLRGEPPTRAIVGVQFVAATGLYQLLAPIDRDGRFELAAVPHGRVRVYAVVRTGASHAVAGSTFDFAAPRTDVALAIAWSHRTVHVVVRSASGAPAGNAQVVVTPGERAASSNLAEMITDFMSGYSIRAHQLEGARVVPDAVARLVRRDDLIATVKHAPEGAATACAWGLPNDVPAELEKKLRANLAKVRVTCAPIPLGPAGASASAIVLEVEPPARLD